MTRVPPTQPDRGRMSAEEFREHQAQMKKLFPGRFARYKKREINEAEVLGIVNLYDDETEDSQQTTSTKL